MTADDRELLNEAERVVKALERLAEDEGLTFCPSTPDKCHGCEVNPSAVAIVRAAMLKARGYVL